MDLSTQHLLLVIPLKCFNLIHVINLDATSGSTELLKIAELE